MSRQIIKAKAKFKKMKKLTRKANRKKVLLAGIIVAVIAIIITVAMPKHSDQEKAETEIFSYHGQTIQLLPDGSFTAALAHNVNKNGTYTKTNDNNRVAVTFTINGNLETGYIINNSLHIPKEWEDGHGHGSIFPRLIEGSSGH